MRKVGFIISPAYQPMGFAVTTPFEIPIARHGKRSTTSCSRRALDRALYEVRSGFAVEDEQRNLIRELWIDRQDTAS